MIGNEGRRKVRSESVALDVMHVLIGVTVVVLAFISFIDPEDNLIFFPVIFFLAAILNLVTGNYRMGHNKRSRRQKLSALLQMLFGILLMALAIISAASIWWR